MNKKEAKATAETWIRNLKIAIEDYDEPDSSVTYYEGKIEGIQETLALFVSQKHSEATT